jgi:exosome complex exonuclease RRP6
MEEVLKTISSLYGAAGGSAEAVQDPTPVLSQCVRHSHAYPLQTAPGASFSHSYLSREYPEFSTRVHGQQERIRSLLTRVVAAVEPGSKTMKQMVGQLQKGEDADLSQIFDVLDRLRESAEGYIDEAKGQHSSQQVEQTLSNLAQLQQHHMEGGDSSPVAGYKKVANTAGRKLPPAVSDKVRQKPQLLFEDTIDNSRESPFQCKLREKYHAMVARDPVADGSGTRRTSNGFSPVIYKSSPGVHPYQHEIDALAYLPWQIVPVAAPQAFVPLDDVSVELIETPTRLQALCDYLEGTDLPADEEDADAAHRWSRHDASGSACVKELAIDLEAHGMRSYQGFCCLMQLSTRQKDFLIDAMALRSHMHLLNRIFANPLIVKVLHGCDGDVVWLQRDFGLYLVNVFDTGQAARVLEYESFGLAYLLKKFPNVDANKEFQTADWRERPLPAHLKKYAREDTHYLLGIYDRVHNELISRSKGTTPAPVIVSDDASSTNWGIEAMVEIPSLLAATLERSKEKTSSVYEKDEFSPKAYKKFMQKRGHSGPKPTAARDSDGEEEEAPLTPKERVFSALFDFRDQLARSEDESPHYVLPVGMLARIADAQPSTIDQLSRCCHNLPELIRAHVRPMLKVVADALSGEPPAAGTPKASTVGNKRPRPAEQTSAAVIANLPTTAKRSKPSAAVAPPEAELPVAVDTSLLQFPVLTSDSTRQVLAPEAVAPKPLLSTSKPRAGSFAVVAGMGAAFSELSVSEAASLADRAREAVMQNWYHVTGVAAFFDIVAPPRAEGRSLHTNAEEASITHQPVSNGKEVREAMDGLLQPVDRGNSSDHVAGRGEEDIRSIGQAGIVSISDKFGLHRPKDKSTQAAQSKPAKAKPAELVPFNYAAAQDTTALANLARSAVIRHSQPAPAKHATPNPYLKHKRRGK